MVRRVSFLVVIGCLVNACAAAAATYTVNGDVVGEVTHYTVKPKETLYSIARHLDLGIVEVLAANPDIDPWTPEVGTKLDLPTAHILPDAPHEGIVINLSELRLFYFPDAQTVMTFPVGVGREGWQTPVGSTTVVKKRKDPAWIPPDSIRKENPKLPAIILPGPNNPLGQYALNLGWDGYRIHGTNRPAGVGKRSSHGCIRLYPEDIKLLFNEVKVGTPVKVIDVPFKLGWQNDVLFLEVSPTQERSDKIADYQVPPPLSIHGVHTAIRKAVGNARADVDWYAVDNAISDQDGIPIVVAKRNSK